MNHIGNNALSIKCWKTKLKQDAHVGPYSMFEVRNYAMIEIAMIDVND